MLGLAARLWLLRFPGYSIDVTLFTEWTEGLLKIPFDEYYGLVSPWCDYLPGYLYVLAATGFIKSLVSGSTALVVQDFEPWIKVGPIFADLVVGLSVYLLCRRFTSSKRSLLAASIILLNPAIMFAGAVWGQVESVAFALYMLALLALVSGSPIVAAVVAGLGFATKPQYAIFLAPAGVAYIRWVTSRWHTRRTEGGSEGWFAWMTRRVFLPIGVLVGTVQLLLIPFSTSLWPLADVDWTFFERVTMAEIGKFASAGAFNLWGTEVAGIRQLDSARGWFSLTHETWGYVLFAACAAFSLVLAWRRSDNPEAVLWAAFLIAFGFFEVLTKMHERYLFMAIPLVAVLAAFRPWVALYGVALSVLYLVNLWYMWTYGADLFANLALTRWASDFSVLLFIGALAAIWAISRLAERDGPPTAGLWDTSTRLRSVSRTRLVRAPTTSVVGHRITLSAGTVMLAIALVLVTGLAVGKYGEEAATRANSAFKIVTIRAFRASWQDSGISVTAGDRVSVIAHGRWSHNYKSELYGPGGNGETPDWNIAPKLPTGALLGRIGDSPPFEIGEYANFIATVSGPLRLVMNDGRRGSVDYQDNRGRVQVALTVDRP